MHIRDLDLNLLPVFNAIHTEGNLTRAGRRLHLTQSAVSHALSRLREIFGDPLFVRQGNGMAPTPLANRLAEQLRQGLDQLERALEDRHEFDPASSDRTFCLCMTDYLAVVMLPKLLQRLKDEAPGVRMRIVHAQYEERARLLREGFLDLFLGCERMYGADIHTAPIFRDREACVVRRGHPLTEGRLTLERFLEQEFIALSLSQTGLGFVEDYLGTRGLNRKIVLTVEQELTIPVLAAGTDYVGTVAERLARGFLDKLPISLLPVPLPHTEFTVLQHWHEASDHDPAHRWLRALIAGVGRELDEEFEGETARLEGPLPHAPAPQGPGE